MKPLLLRVLKYTILTGKKFSTDAYKTFQVEYLKNKSLISVSGNEVQNYMQGLITNDMKHLAEGSPCMYAMFLNNKGRVLYDTIIYNTNEPNEFFIECDKSALNPLIKHLLIYKIRRKINVKSVSDEYNVWSASKLSSDKGEENKNDVKSTVDLLKESLHKCLVCCDPRTPSLGVRIIAPKDIFVNMELEKLSCTQVKLNNFYKALRYKLGIGEGVDELPPGNCNPLEANCDYLHGVSFYKGCYIGQELTARTYHTGVIRKRLMPLKFDENLFYDKNDIAVFAANDPKKPIGKLRGAEGSLGIGLLRIQEALTASKLKINGVLSTTSCPHWWPTEFPKDPIKMFQANSFSPMAKDPKDDNKKIQWFECYICHLRENYEIKAKSVPFAKHINFKQESYFLKDPFSEPETKNILLLGSDCIKCNKQICQSAECSIFFKQRYCHECAFKDKDHFPEQLKSKIKIT